MRGSEWTPVRRDVEELVFADHTGHAACRQKARYGQPPAAPPLVRLPA